jgi:hypothetical protein
LVSPLLNCHSLNILLSQLITESIHDILTIYCQRKRNLIEQRNETNNPRIGTNAAQDRTICVDIENRSRHPHFKIPNDNAEPQLPRPLNPHFSSIATASGQRSPLAVAAGSTSRATQNFNCFARITQRRH